jgi:hypothetical protein
MTYYSRSKPYTHDGVEGIRTLYLFNAIEALSQVSYDPASKVETMGFEPTTSSVRLKRSPN